MNRRWETFCIKQARSGEFERYYRMTSYGFNSRTLQLFANIAFQTRNFMKRFKLYGTRIWNRYVKKNDSRLNDIKFQLFDEVWNDVDEPSHVEEIIAHIILYKTSIAFDGGWFQFNKIQRNECQFLLYFVWQRKPGPECCNSLNALQW